MTDSTAAFRLEPDPEPQPDHERPAKGRNGAVMNTNHLTDEQLLNFAYAYAAHHGSTADAMRAALATLPEPERIGAGGVRVGDVIDVTYRVTVTAVDSECNVSTDDRRPHNLHAHNVTAHLISRPDPDAERVAAVVAWMNELAEPGADDADAARDLLARLDAMGADRG